MRLEPVEYWPEELPGMQVVRTVEAARQMERCLAGQPELVFDTETSGLAWYRDAEVIGAAFGAWISGQLCCWYLPFRHTTIGRQVPEDIALPMVERILRSAGVVIAHNIKFDEHFARKELWPIGRRYDTMVGCALYNENIPLKLERRAQEHLGIDRAFEWNDRVQERVAELAKAASYGKTEYLERFGYSEVDVNLLGLYACHDVLYTGLLYRFLEDHGVLSTYKRIWATETELTRILGEMENHGLLVDREYLLGLRRDLLEARDRYQTRLRQFFGRGFNPGSDDEVREILYHQYKLNIIKHTQKGAASVDADVLRYYQDRVPELSVLQDWRDVDKLATTYTDSILRRTDRDDVCHPDFQQVGAITSRMACKSPNLQNISTDDKDRAEAHGGQDPWSIRRAFIVRQKDGRPVPRLLCDYNQVELRIIAHYTRDPIMVDVYLHDGDIHARTQQEIQSVLNQEVPRRLSKSLNFGMAYGISPQGVSRQTGMTLEDSREFFAAFEDRYSGVVRFRQWFWNQIRARLGHWFENLWGRRRRIPHIVAADRKVRSRAERQAMSTLIQGTAAEITKESLVRIDRVLKEAKLPAQLCNVVHDDIQLDCEAQALAEVVPLVKREMERYPEFAPIPIKVDGDYTVTSWSQKLKLPM